MSEMLFMVPLMLIVSLASHSIPRYRAPLLQGATRVRLAPSITLTASMLIAAAAKCVLITDY